MTTPETDAQTRTHRSAAACHLAVAACAGDAPLSPDRPEPVVRRGQQRGAGAALAGDDHSQRRRRHPPPAVLHRAQLLGQGLRHGRNRRAAAVCPAAALRLSTSPICWAVASSARRRAWRQPSSPRSPRSRSTTRKKRACTSRPRCWARYRRTCSSRRSLTVSATVSCRWLAYILVTTAALYTHYFAATVVMAQDVAIAIWFIAYAGAAVQRNGRELVRRVAPLVAAQALIALFYLPWLPTMATQFSNWPAISEFYSLPTLVNKLFFIFSMGFSVDPQAMWQNGLVTAAALVFALLLALGMAYRLLAKRTAHGARRASPCYAPGHGMAARAHPDHVRALLAPADVQSEVPAGSDAGILSAAWPWRAGHRRACSARARRCGAS